MKTLLIIHGGALGDFILALPAMISLRKYLPYHLLVGIINPVCYYILKYIKILLECMV